MLQLSAGHPGRALCIATQSQTGSMLLISTLALAITVPAMLWIRR